MKKHFKYLSMLTVAALTVGFASCSSDDEAGQGQAQGNEQAVLAINLIDEGTAMTYAPSSTASSEESKINDGKLYIFDSASKLEKIVDAQVSQSGIKLTPGSKKVYYIANTGGTNIPEIPTEKTPKVGETTIAQFQALAFSLPTSSIEDVTQQAAVPTGNFYITNATTGSITLTQGSTATLNLQIGRGMAKTNVEFPSTVVQPLTGTLSDAQFMVRNNAAKMFYVPNIDPYGVLTTPYYDNASISDGTYFDNGTVPNISDWKDPDASNITGLIPAVPEPNNIASYVMENSNKTPKYGNYTYILMRGQFVPNEGHIFDKNGAKATYNAGTDFYRLQYIETKQDRVYYRGFYKNRFYVNKPALSNKEFEDANNPANLPAAANGGTVKAVAVKYQGSGTTGAYCYYYIGIGDKAKTNTDADTQAAMRLTVERNKYYYYNIKSVVACGHNTPTPIGPDVPVSSDAMLNVEISAGPWGIVGGENGIDTDI